MENYNKIENNEYGIYYYLNNLLHRIDGPAIECINGTKYWYQNGLKHRLDGPAIELWNGDKEWWENGLLHRLDGCACEYINGDKQWWFKGKHLFCSSQKEFEKILNSNCFDKFENYNRVEEDDRAIKYYLYNSLHRLDGAAVEYNDGSKEWWKNGKQHRIDGPAIEYTNGIKHWYYEGKWIDCNSQEEFERYVKLKLFW